MRVELFVQNCYYSHSRPFGAIWCRTVALCCSGCQIAYRGHAYSWGPVIVRKTQNGVLLPFCAFRAVLTSRAILHCFVICVRPEKSLKGAHAAGRPWRHQEQGMALIQGV